MGSSDPEMRMRQLAKLRAAYDASCSRLPGGEVGSAAHHSRALLGQILVVLGGMQDGAVARTGGPSGEQV